MAEFLNFIRAEQRRSKVMTFARIETTGIKHNVNRGCFDGSRTNPGKNSEKT